MLWWCQVNYLKMSAWGWTKDSSSAFSTSAMARGRAGRTRAAVARGQADEREGERGTGAFAFLLNGLEPG